MNNCDFEELELRLEELKHKDMKLDSQCSILQVLSLVYLIIALSLSFFEGLLLIAVGIAISSLVLLILAIYYLIEIVIVSNKIVKILDIQMDYLDNI